jgi:hypothetical protein
MISAAAGLVLFSIITSGTHLQEFSSWQYKHIGYPGCLGQGRGWLNTGYFSIASPVLSPASVRPLSTERYGVPA